MINPIETQMALSSAYMKMAGFALSNQIKIMQLVTTSVMAGPFLSVRAVHEAAAKPRKAAAPITKPATVGDAGVAVDAPKPKAVKTAAKPAARKSNTSKAVGTKAKPAAKTTAAPKAPAKAKTAAKAATKTKTVAKTKAPATKAAAAPKPAATAKAAATKKAGTASEAAAKPRRKTRAPSKPPAMPEATTKS